MSDSGVAQAASAQFADMSRKISDNQTNGFCGAVVAFPPAGDPVELLMLANGDEALFWGTLMTQIQIRLNQIKEGEGQQANGWGARR